MSKGILLIEDDKSLNRAVSLKLSKEGYEVYSAETLKEGWELYQCQDIVLIICDIGLPDGSGLDFCSKVRSIKERTTVFLFLTAMDTETDIIMGYEVGGDDYVTKPFKLGELCSRIRALLRRAGVTPQDKASVLKCGDISIDFLSCRVILNNKILELTNAEYRLLCLLVRNANRIVSRDIILNDLWDGTGNFVDDNTLSVYIRRLREKVETDASHPQRLITIRGFGYQWKEV